ncbi:hypothetical protein Pse7367_3553 [Thalassoporum mexicanum PCC 7367]|uniref:hypothetical protein n=1 Tax=Thalassoporum mexicanum TaxID=3457544 RepID=UPI00029FA364|nr:hypothetical protein [Pseudanabaena sp. PCC 7367]AFY71788.1 hypothetical protein Pse7367_3553 [Pseudanabaena sp. PCC 7367]
MTADTQADVSQIRAAKMTSPYRTTIDISDEALEQFHRWTGYNTHDDMSSNTRFQMRDFHIDLGMAVLGFAVLCNWSIKARKIDFKGKTHLLYELRGSSPPQEVPMYRQNCSEEMALFLHNRLIRTLDFLRVCSKYSGVPHVHVICIRNCYVMSAVWRPYQNKLWMIPIDQVEGLAFSNHVI